MTAQTKKRAFSLSQPWVQSVAAIVVIFGALASFLFWNSAHSKVSIDTSVLSAPTASIAATAGGPLNALYVKEGDRVPENAPIAQVGTETLYAKTGGHRRWRPAGRGLVLRAGPEDTVHRGRPAHARRRHHR